MVVGNLTLEELVTPHSQLSGASHRVNIEPGVEESVDSAELEGCLLRTDTHTKLGYVSCVEAKTSMVACRDQSGGHLWRITKQSGQWYVPLPEYQRHACSYSMLVNVLQGNTEHECLANSGKSC